jgi:hypothetical protein
LKKDVVDRVVDNQICALRKKFEPFGDALKAVYGKGYVFDPELVRKEKILHCPYPINSVLKNS